jgi:hypothetical protein
MASEKVFLLFLLKERQKYVWSWAKKIFNDEDFYNFLFCKLLFWLSNQVIWYEQHVWHARKTWKVGILEAPCFDNIDLINKIWHKQFAKTSQGSFIYNFASLSCRKYGCVYTSWTLNIRSFVRVSPPHTTVVHVHSRSYAIDRQRQSWVGGGVPPW